MGQHRSTQRHVPHGRNDEARLVADMIELARQFGRYGTYKVVRGEHVIWAEHDPRPCQIPPNWSGGYSSIYAAQAGEDKSAGGMV